MLKLSQKSYILIAVPLFFEVVFVAALITTQEKLNLSFQEQTKLRDTTNILDGILKNFMQCLTERALYQFSHNERFSKEHQQTLDNLKMGMMRLRGLERVGEDPLLDRLDENVKGVLDKLENTHIAMHSENQYQVMFNLIKLKTMLDNVIKCANELSEQQQAKIAQKEEVETKLRHLIAIIAVAGVSVSVLLSIAIAISFQRMLVRKIAVLSENGIRLAANQPLLPELNGDDELSQLDANFHSMAHSLAYLRSKELAVIDNAVEIICSLDRKGQFTQVNDAVKSLLQYDAKELTGRSISTIALTRADEIKEKMSTIMSAAAAVPFQISLRRKDLVIRDFMWSMTWNQREKTFFCVAHDVTERNRIDQFKRDMIAMVSHDLRSPLTSLQAAFELYADGSLGTLNEKGVQKTNQGIGIIRRLVGKINALLDIEQLESGKITLSVAPTIMETLVDHAIESIYTLAERKNILVKRVNTDVHQIDCDAERVTDVLINFLHNAVKFSPKNGHINVTVSVGRELEVAVADEGSGVPESEREAIFERFRQSSADSHEVQAQGNGLGLAIAKAVVTAHGGTIGVRPNTPTGSVFWFKIPFHDNE